MQLIFDRGTLLIHGNPVEAGSLPGVLWDPRVQAWRAPAYLYRELAGELARQHPKFHDEVCPELLAPPGIVPPDLRPYQTAAAVAWELAGRRGIIALPTGAGKTRTAIAIMARTGLRTLCLAPTRVLMAQWVKLLGAAVPGPIGEYGDGRRFEHPITVATFAGALRNVEVIGNRFELLVVDEVHHFGSGSGDEALEMCTAQARLGLSATPPEDPTRRTRLEALIGPEVYRASVADLAGSYLAAFQLVTISTTLVPEERRAYDRELAVFQPVCRRFFTAAPDASWKDFVLAAGKSSEGRRALAAWRHTRSIVAYGRAKRRVVHDLLRQHQDHRTLIFASDNETAYAVAQEHLIQPITCDIGARERERALRHFATGELRTLVSARVLNEGIDVPAADVAIVVGGSQGSREYIQRVGRVLRPAEGKTAIVYDLVTLGTYEVRHADRHRRALAAE